MLWLLTSLIKELRTNRGYSPSSLTPFSFSPLIKSYISPEIPAFDVLKVMDLSVIVFHLSATT